MQLFFMENYKTLFGMSDSHRVASGSIAHFTPGCRQHPFIIGLGADESKKESALLAGMDFFLPKKYSVPEITEQISLIKECMSSPKSSRK